MKTGFVNTCLHCSMPSVGSYCCPGCEALAHFVKNKPFLGSQNLTTKSQNPQVYDFLDDPEECEEYVETLSSGHKRVKFHLEGIHCTSCLITVEKLGEILKNCVIDTKLNFQKAIVTIEYIPAANSLSLIAQTLLQLGYPPTPLKVNQRNSTLHSIEHRKLLKQVAIAGACAGNIMLFSIGIYAGAEGIIKEYFDGISFVLSLPVLFYSAQSIFKDAFRSLKQKKWSIDAPIVIALSVGWGVSLWSVWNQLDYNFVDSLSGLVFFLLVSRYLLLRVQQSVFVKTESLDPLFPKTVQTLAGQTKKTSDLIKGDFIRIVPQTKFPVDGVVKEGEGWVDLSLLNGESTLEKITVGQKIFAGTLNQTGNFVVEVERTKEQTRLGQMIEQVQSFDPHKNSIARLSDQVAKYFTMGVVLLSLAVMIYWSFIQSNTIEGLQRTLLLLIVSCPCAFALATPLALVFSFTLLLQKGVYLKSISSLEKVLKIKNIVFDKTGTLTQGVLQIQKLMPLHPMSDSELERYETIIYSMELKSEHPFALALIQYFEAQKRFKALELSDWKELVGKGVQAIYQGKRYEIKRQDQDLGSKANPYSKVVLCENETPVIEIQIKNSIREDAPFLFAILRRKYQLWICSGDKQQPVEWVAQKLGLDSQFIQFEKSPEQKLEFIKSLKEPTLYIGDGANDSLVLSQSELGIAAFGAFDLSLQAADGYLLKPRLKSLVDLIHIAQETDQLLKRHFVFTIIYNSFAMGLAVSGKLSPLVAAVLMPLSSILILISTLVATKNLRRMRKESL